MGRVGRYSNLRSQLQEIDPDNLLLQTLADPKSYVPTEADIEAMRLEVARARARPPASQGPVNTPSDPGGPEGSSGAQLLRPTERDAKPTNPSPRSLTTEDLGVKGNVKELNGTISVQGKIAVVQIDMIEGVISNPNSVLPNLMRLARFNGADILIVRATVANPKLYELMMRMGATSERGVEILTIPLK